MNQYLQKLISELEVRLAAEKPGMWAQQLMMPEGRILSPEHETAPINSAVLICLYISNNDLYFPIIRRPQYDGPHSGQIAFPGGKFEPNDISLIHTALREAYEEVGIIPGHVKVIGTLSPLYIPVTNMQVLPVVGFVTHEPNFILNPAEVDALFTLPMHQLINATNKITEQWELRGNLVNVPYYFLHEQKIWGATAMMLSELEQLIKPYYENEEILKNLPDNF